MVIAKPYDRDYLNFLRGASILRVMLAHLGLSWFYPPYSQYIGIFLPIFFFVSGAVYYNSIANNRKRSYAFLNRYIVLTLPFFIFTLPYIFNESLLTGFDVITVISFLLAWPDLSIYPFNMKQLWFINALIIMFFASHYLFKASKQRGRFILLAYVISLFYIAYSDGKNLPHFYAQFDWIRALNMPNQLHQILSLFNFYLAGALYYIYKPVAQNINRIILIPIAILCGFMYLGLDDGIQMKRFLFERNLYFTAFSYWALSLTLFLQPYLKALVYQRQVFSFFNLLSQNSYSLFLIHTAILFAVEHLFSLHTLTDSPLLAILRLVIVIALSCFLAPYFTALCNQAVNSAKFKLTRRELIP